MDNRITTGIIAGGIIGAVGVGLALSDSRTRRKLADATRKAVGKDEV